MNKSLLTILSVALMLTVKSQVVYSSSFENWTNTDPNGWMGSATNIAADSVNQITGQSAYGNSAAQLNNPSTTHKRLTTTALSITNGTSYTITYWVKGSGLIRAGIYDGGSGVNAYAYSSYDTLLGATNWTQYSHTMVADSTSATAQFIISVKSTAGPSHMQIDSFVVNTAAALPTSIYNIQYTLSPSGDSPLNGQTVNTGGIVTAKTSTAYWLQAGAGAWSGIYVLDGTNAANVAIGDSVTLTALVDEYFNLTELKNVANFVKVSTGNTVPAFTVISTGDANTEPYESVLVQVQGAQCTNANAGFGQWVVYNSVDSVFVDDLMYAYTPTLNAYYSVAGVVYYSFSEWKIEPRMTSDVTVVTGIESVSSSAVIAMFPNPSSGKVTVADVNAKDVVNVYDVSGKVVYSEKVTQSGNFTFMLDGSGVYFVQLSGERGVRTSKLVICK